MHAIIDKAITKKYAIQLNRLVLYLSIIDIYIQRQIR